MSAVMRRSLGVAVAALALAAPAAAQAPPLTERVFINVNAAVQEGSTHLAVATPLPAFGKEGTLAVDHNLAGGNLFDVSGFVRLRGGLLFGVGYSHVSSTDAPPYKSTIPSPVDGFTPLTTQGTVGLTHSENVVYVSAAFARAVTDHFVYMVTAGPAFFRAEQDLPFTSAIFAPNGVVTTTQPTTTLYKESTVGFQGGLDLNYMFARNLGGGLLFRYTWGSVDWPYSTSSMTLGGVQLGAGVRARF
jgi:hypothetical protein